MTSPLKGLPYPLRFYDNGLLWCRKGGHWIKKESADKAFNGKLICPIHHCGVRTRKPHKPKSMIDNRARVETHTAKLPVTEIAFFRPRWLSKYYVRSIQLVGDLSLAYELYEKEKSKS